MKQARRTRAPRRQQARRQQPPLAAVTNGTINPASIDDFIRDQRTRLVGKREEIMEEQQSLTQELTTIEHELAAIEAYEKVRGQQGRGAQIVHAARARRPSGAGKHPRPAHRPRGERQKAAAPAPRKLPGPRKGSSREEVLNIVKLAPGLDRQEIRDRMGLPKVKQNETRISNALTALIRRKRVERRDRRYYPVETAAEAAAAT